MAILTRYTWYSPSDSRLMFCLRLTTVFYARLGEGSEIPLSELLIH